MITFEQFASIQSLSNRTVQWKAQKSGYRYIEHMGRRYDLVVAGKHENGTPRYMVKGVKMQTKKVHLSAEQRDAALSMLNDLMSRDEARAIHRVADHFGVSYHSVYRLWKERNVERKQRHDAGQWRKIIPREARELFESVYIKNAQGPNVQFALNLTRRQFPGWTLPVRYFREIAREIEPERLRYHQEAEFEKQYAGRSRRDLWSEFEYMERISLDGWTVPDRVLRSTGLGDLTEKKFQFNNKHTSLVVIGAIDQKTGDVIAFRALERSVTAEDVLGLLLDVMHRRGRPTDWLMDNGAEFVNEKVQRFLRGIYTTEEHASRERVIFSEPYGPFGKARHERLHKVWKDEFCAFSQSYSPNQKESRKPTKRLSSVTPTQTLAEWVKRFENYLNGYFREAQRIMWIHPDYSRTHEINAKRPHTLNEAVDRAYATWQRVDVEPMKLAFLYASKFTAKQQRGMFNAPARIGMGRKLRYLCETLPPSRWHETFEIVVNPLNLAQAWVCDLKGNCIGEAWDIRAKDASVRATREHATVYRKHRNRINKLARESAALKAELADMDVLLAPTTGVTDPVTVQQNAVTEIYAGVQIEETNQHFTDEDTELFFDEDTDTTLMEGNNE